MGGALLLKPELLAQVFIGLEADLISLDSHFGEESRHSREGGNPARSRGNFAIAGAPPSRGWRIVGLRQGSNQTKTACKGCAAQTPYVR